MSNNNEVVGWVNDHDWRFYTDTPRPNNLKSIEIYLDESDEFNEPVVLKPKQADDAIKAELNELKESLFNGTEPPTLDRLEKKLEAVREWEQNSTHLEPDDDERLELKSILDGKE